MTKNESHLLQMRGLKRKLHKFISKLDKSHLLQMRGLKPRGNRCAQYIKMSHLLQMRGLKHFLLKTDHTQ